jgi:Methylamine utilization protein MauJ
MGVPGEVQNLVVINIKAGEPLPNSDAHPWKPGQYRVQLMLGRPGHPTNSEYEHRFIGPNDGTSHMQIVKPLANRKPSDNDHMIWWSSYIDKTGKRVDLKFKGEANAQGFLSKFSTTFEAKDPNEAAWTAHASLAPLLSGLAASADLPLFIETIDAIEIATGNAMLRIVAPFPEQVFGLGQLPHMSEDYCHYASLYREALQSSSSFYRFLCLFKIVEGLHKRRGRLTVEAKRQGTFTSRKPLIPERIPSDKAEQIRLLKAVYSIRSNSPWDDMFIALTFPVESHGKSVKEVRDEILEKIRDTVAHAVMLDGEPGLSVDDLEDHWKVNKWLPLLRFMARLMLTNDFPAEFQLGTAVKYEPDKS